MSSLHERRMQILSRMQLDPTTAVLLARARSAATARAARPADAPAANAPTHEVITARVSRSAPVRTFGVTQTHLSTGVSGRLVRAEEANLNGAFFTTGDLEFGLGSLAGAPLTWNHEDSGRGAYGWIEEANLVSDPDNGPHIVIGGRVWTARFPAIAQSLDTTLAAGIASLSMECMAQSVQCMQDGCGAEVADDIADACPHIMERSGVRRMVNPTFYGAALILDGVKPGWPGASLSVA